METTTARDEIFLQAGASGWTRADQRLGGGWVEFVHEDGRLLTLDFTATGRVGFLSVHRRDANGVFLASHLVERERRAAVMRELVATGLGRFGFDR